MHTLGKLRVSIIDSNGVVLVKTQVHRYFGRNGSRHVPVLVRVDVNTQLLSGSGQLVLIRRHIRIRVMRTAHNCQTQGQGSHTIQ